MSFSKIIASSCFQQPPPSLPPQIRQLISSLKKPTPNLLTFLHKTSFHHNSTTTTTTTTSYNIISEDFCTWVISFCNSRFLKDGVCIHSPIIKLGFKNHLLLNNNLLSLYSKCFGVEDAHKVFEDMPNRDVVSWTGIISAYVKDGNYFEALNLFHDMRVFGLIVPNEFTFSSVLRSCSSLLAFELGISTHAEIIKHGFESNPVLASVLIDFYSKCGCFDESFKIFGAMNSGDTISWTTMISSFIQNEDWSQGLKLFLRMIEAGVPPNEFTFVKILSACSFLGIEYGKLVHAHVVLIGFELNLVLKTALVDMYSKWERMEDANRVSNQTRESDVMLCTAMINGYTRVSNFDKAISAFRKMQITDILPNAFTYAGILNTCSSIPAWELGKQIHSRVIKASLESDVSVGNALVDMYMKSSEVMVGVGNALRAFNEIISPNVVSWTSLITGFSQHELEYEAFQVFMEMQVLGMQPNCITLTGILNSCVTKEAPSHIRMLHTYIFKIDRDSDISVANSLLEAYARLGMVKYAWNVINILTHKDAVTYTNLAAGMNQMGNPEMTLSVIAHMHEDNVKMDGFSLATFLSASASLVALEPGKQLHGYSVKSSLSSWISVSNGLVDLYGKCGSIHDAQKAFTEILEPNVVSWNVLISGLASNGHFSSALSGFEDMRLASIQPDHITFLLVLYACSHGGLIDRGVEYFYSMSTGYGIETRLDHYICLVDLLGRAGRLEEAISVIDSMPFKPDALIYKTLLGSCKVHGNVAMGEDMARRALELDPSDPAVYVLLANIYDDTGKSEFGDLTRQMMRNRGLKKNPGQSWMEIRNRIHLFSAGDRSHPQMKEIHEKLESLRMGLKRLGYEYNIDDNVGLSSSLYHSEKLAIAFGLLNTPLAAPVRVIKNLRICKDCHTFAKLVSKLVDREIIVRDGNRFHSFKKGNCSCLGYW